ncbi:hypothetical protein BU26DRAFT_568114 [Trematosphaeria pertusa]|uniref:DUF6590 domain-containing protein n=1 Tax=Trematosphaeria pertusa TaxID=390896 RepID=A0A6A6I7P9_9PLEO|nr:uncharacterized protein BU26DRAFT_568114 [Trematosphaeria pertusa]KAF2245540.1 hypothetical protein BU26DRAFT_568114 [Trematosphaeria pertusa]
MSDVAQSPWTWDPSRHQYYYVHNGHWVFQDGLKICISSSYEPQESDEDRQRREQDERNRQGKNHLKDNNPGGSGAGHNDDQRDSDDEAQSLQSHVSAGPSDEDRLRCVNRKIVVQPNDPRYPDVRVHRRLSGSPGDTEYMDPNFRLHHAGFFRVGVVFRILWPELSTDIEDNISIVAMSTGEDQYSFLKIRCFVVVREGQDDCLCVPLKTYHGRRALGNAAQTRRAAIYSVGISPLPIGLPIHVISSDYLDHIAPSSCVDFSKMYAVEHNVKVRDFGRVDANDQWKLLAQFQKHWQGRG